MTSELQNIIKFWPESKDKILSGVKTESVRCGERHFYEGQVLDAIVNETGEKIAKLEVIELKQSSFNQLREGDAVKNGYQNTEDFWNGLRKSFPHITKSEEFTIVKFKRV